MAKIYVPAAGPKDWQKFLKEPKLQWKTGYSAKTLAYSWHAAEGWPPEIQQIFAAAPEPALRSAQPLLGIPEKITAAAGAGEPPHNDVFVLARTAGGHLVSITVEGKVDEAFGDSNQTVAAWKHDGNVANRRLRLAQFLDKTEMDEARADLVAYQLLQRTASAVIEAENFNAQFAAMIVHSFSREDKHFAAFATFASAYGISMQPGQMAQVAKHGNIRLFIGWARGDLRFLSS